MVRSCSYVVLDYVLDLTRIIVAHLRCLLVVVAKCCVVLVHVWIWLMRANGKKEKYQKICNKKMQTTPELLCKGYDVEFIDYLKYCRNLKFDQQPDYVYLRNLFRTIMNRYQYQYDWQFDWCLLQNNVSTYNVGGAPALQITPPVQHTPTQMTNVTPQQPQQQPMYTSRTQLPPVYANQQFVKPVQQPFYNPPVQQTYTYDNQQQTMNGY